MGSISAVSASKFQAFSIGNEVRMKIPPNAICSGLAGVAAVADITALTAGISVGQGAVALSRTKPTVIQFVAKCFIAFAIAMTVTVMPIMCKGEDDSMLWLMMKVKMMHD